MTTAAVTRGGSVGGRNALLRMILWLETRELLAILSKVADGIREVTFLLEDELLMMTERFRFELVIFVEAKTPSSLSSSSNYDFRVD